MRTYEFSRKVTTFFSSVLILDFYYKLFFSQHYDSTLVMFQLYSQLREKKISKFYFCSQCVQNTNLCCVVRATCDLILNMQWSCSASSLYNGPVGNIDY